MTVIIKPINTYDIPDLHYREFDNVGSIEDKHYPIVKLLHKDRYNTYVMMEVPDNCYLLVIDEED